MDVRVSGHQVDVGVALRAHAEDRIRSLSDKYDARAISSSVTLGKGPHDHRFDCEIVLYVPNGVVLKGGSRGIDAQPAFEDALGKIEKQMRRYMRRLRGRNGQPTAADLAFDNAATRSSACPIWRTRRTSRRTIRRSSQKLGSMCPTPACPMQ